MNEVLKNIAERRSVRHYKPEQITVEELQTVIDAGVQAPSARNRQLRHITVVQNSALLDEMAAKINHLLGDREEDYHVFHHAPTVLVLSAEKGASYDREDAGIMIENMCLAARPIGLDSCILGLPNILFQKKEGEKYLKILGIPENYAVTLSLSLGYSSIGHNPHARERNYDIVNYIR